MTQQVVPAAQPPGEQPPHTGNRTIDAALAELGGLSEAPVTERLERICAAHEVLVQVLETSRDEVQTPIPGVHGR